MASNQQPNASIPFWDSLHSFDPESAATGQGVDHNNMPPPPPQWQGGFPFPFGGPGHQGPPGQGPAAWAGPFGWGAWADDSEGGPWGGRRGFGRRGGRHAHPHPHHAHGHRHGRGRRGDDAPEAGTRDAAGISGSDNEQDAAYNEKGDSPETMRADVPDPAEVAPEDDDQPTGRHGHCGRGQFGRGGRGGFRRGGGRFGPHAGGPPNFDFGGMMRGLASSPFFQNLRTQAENYARGQTNDESGGEGGDAFLPPVDVFNTERAFVLHVALPGAKKEDIGVNWDQERGALTVAGVVHRPGDEEFIRTLANGERRVGEFQRSVPLPPAGAAEREEIDGFAITARMEDGILIVTVPKVEKEWTEIRKVDIE